MSDNTQQTNLDDPITYEIRIKGHLSADWDQWFDCLSVVQVNNGETILKCAVCDQSALYGLLRRIRDLGLPLISVIQVTPDRADD